MIRGFFILTGLYLAGEALHQYFSLFLPGGVIAMLLTAVLLCGGLLDIRRVEAAAQVLLANMGLFFVPAGVGLLVYFQIVAAHWLMILLVTVLSFVAVLASTGLTMQALARRRRREDE